MKNQIRQKYKQIRQMLSTTEVINNSKNISIQLFQTPFWQNSQTVMLYLSFQNEVITDLIYQQGWSENKNMLAPICSAKEGYMRMSLLSSFSQLQFNQYGIRELPIELQQIMVPENIDLCLIPGIAFDLTGNRLGFGSGYYDRYLAKVPPHAIRIALAFECQIYPETIPTDTYDLPMDYILTEKQLYRIISQ